MENFFYSINITLPIFLVMVIGWVLRQKGMLNDNFVTVANRFNFSVTLPVMLFRDISAVDIRGTFDASYVLFCAVVSTICFWGIWGGVKLFLKDKSMRGAFVQASFRSSAAVVDKTVDNISRIATPLALISMGAGFQGREALAKMKPTLCASAVKLVIQPLIFLPAAVWMGFTGEKLIAILIMLAAPTTPSCYIMAKNMRNDGGLTASIIVMTTLLAAFTLTGWIYILKTLGMI